MNIHPRERALREKLIEVAQRQDLITYKEAGDLVGLPAISVGPLVLDPINIREVREGRPMLSSTSRRGHPARGS